MHAIDERLASDAATWRAQIDERADAVIFRPPNTRRDGVRRRPLAIAATIVVVLLIAFGISNSVRHSTSAPPGSAGQLPPSRSTSPSLASGLPSPSKTARSLPNRPGYTRVIVPGHAGEQGYVKNTDLQGPLPPNPRLAVLWQHNRGDSVSLFPVYDTHDTVIGSYRIGDSTPLHLDCDTDNGYAFALRPPTGHGAAPSPAAAAKQVYARYGLKGYDAPASSWQVTASDDHTATVTSGRITLRTLTWPDNTWIVVSGQHCS